jgi:hypothetical protein
LGVSTYILGISIYRDRNLRLLYFDQGKIKQMRLRDLRWINVNL